MSGTDFQWGVADGLLEGFPEAGGRASAEAEAAGGSGGAPAEAPEKQSPEQAEGEGDGFAWRTIGIILLTVGEAAQQTHIHESGAPPMK